MFKEITAKGLAAAGIAYMSIASVVVVLVILMFHEIPQTNKEYFLMVIGALIAWGTNGVHFFLGSSKGSKEKTAALAAELAQDQD